MSLIWPLKKKIWKAEVLEMPCYQNMKKGAWVMTSILKIVFFVSDKHTYEMSSTHYTANVYRQITDKLRHFSVTSTSKCLIWEFLHQCYNHRQIVVKMTIQ